MNSKNPDRIRFAKQAYDPGQDTYTNLQVVHMATEFLPYLPVSERAPLARKFLAYITEYVGLDDEKQ
jgi:hypothetical protein